MTDLAIATSRVTCEVAPVQIEGTLTDGRYFYFRARHRSISLGVGATAEEAVAGDDIGFRMSGFDSDRHAWSWIDPHHAMNLLQFMVATFAHCEGWVGR